MLEVGTTPRPDSLTSGNKILMSEPLYKKEFFLDTIPISFILFLLANLIIGIISSDLPGTKLSSNQRYARSREVIEILKQAWKQDQIDFQDLKELQIIWER